MPKPMESVLSSPTAPFSNHWSVSCVIFQTIFLHILRIHGYTHLQKQKAHATETIIFFKFLFTNKCSVQIPFISYLLLCNRPHSSFVAYNNHHFICADFCGPGRAVLLLVYAGITLQLQLAGGLLGASVRMSHSAPCGFVFK